MISCFKHLSLKTAKKGKKINIKTVGVHGRKCTRKSDKPWRNVRQNGGLPKLERWEAKKLLNHREKTKEKIWEDELKAKSEYITGGGSLFIS